jgi:hypothetical protein
MYTCVRTWTQRAAAQALAQKSGHQRCTQKRKGSGGNHEDHVHRQGAGSSSLSAPPCTPYRQPGCSIPNTSDHQGSAVYFVQMSCSVIHWWTTLYRHDLTRFENPHLCAAIQAQPQSRQPGTCALCRWISCNLCNVDVAVVQHCTRAPGHLSPLRQVPPHVLSSPSRARLCRTSAVWQRLRTASPPSCAFHLCVPPVATC